MRIFPYGKVGLFENFLIHIPERTAESRKERVEERERGRSGARERRRERREEKREKRERERDGGSARWPPYLYQQLSTI